MQANLEVNECLNIRLIRCVVSDSAGMRQLSLATVMNSGSSSLFRPTAYPLPAEEVRGYGLADLVHRLGVDQCDLMKVDIEGAECDVFMSAAETLKSGIVKYIVLEIHNSILKKRGLSGEVLHRHILENGYELNADLGHWVYSFKERVASN